MIAHLGYIIQPPANVLLEIGIFHFQVIGNIISGFRWKDEVFQSGISSSGSLLDVLVGSHYNW